MATLLTAEHPLSLCGLTCIPLASLCSRSIFDTQMKAFGAFSKISKIVCQVKINIYKY